MSVLSIVVLLTVVASLLTLAGRHRAIVLASIRRFFTEPGSPFNLAVARIVFFAVVLWEISAVGLRDVQDYSRLPAGLITPPHDLGGLLAALPINPTCVTVAWAALVTAGVLGLVGVFPRLSALVVVIAGFYYLGVPQLYGYVKHDQHIIWIGAILAVSPSADALSLQAVWRAWRRPSTPPERRSAAKRAVRPAVALHLAGHGRPLPFCRPGEIPLRRLTVARTQHVALLDATSLRMEVCLMIDGRNGVIRPD